MIRLALILAALLSGCVERTVQPINPGAAWEIYLVDQGTYSAWYPGHLGAAICDHDRHRLVLINDDTPAVREACRQMTHEPAHLYERKYPDIWDKVAAFNAPGFDVIHHGTVEIPPPRLIH